VYFHPEAEGVAQRADPKEKPSLLRSVTSPRPKGPAKGGNGVGGVGGGRAVSVPTSETETN